MKRGAAEAGLTQSPRVRPKDLFQQRTEIGPPPFNLNDKCLIYRQPKCPCNFPLHGVFDPVVISYSNTVRKLKEVKRKYFPFLTALRKACRRRNKYKQLS